MDMKLHVLMERIVGTFEFEGFSESGHWSIQTAIIVVLPGGESKVKGKAILQRVEDHDRML